MSLINWLAPMLCFFVAMGAAQWIRKNASMWGLVDKPNSRSSHLLPTPRGGGLGVVAASEAVTLICAWRGWMPLESALALAIGGGLIALVGFLDDRRSLPALIRFVVHLFAAVTVALLTLAPAWRLTHVDGLLYAVLTVLVLVWGTNSFNFMDGIDGIAASQAVFMAGAGAFLNDRFTGPGSTTLLLASLAAASLGFLCLNWPPAKIFMGDGASGFLGFTLSTFAMAPLGSPQVSLSVWIILGGLFVCDSSITLLRRMLRGERFFQAHRLHAYQHLARRFNGHLPVTSAYAALNIIWLFPWAYYAASHPQSTSWIVPSALVPVIALLLAAGAGQQERPSVA